jgi:nucleoside-diphosphate-sugar epimerase
LYGGAGFIGQHLACSILHRTPRDRVVLLDIQQPSAASWKVPLAPFLDSGRLEMVRCDVRDAERVFDTASRFDVIVNLAAVHREPGHKPAEYFETNVAGARNLCELARRIDCRELIFTSSISVYGVHDREVDERATLRPQTPYGRSKLEAEEIHRAWAEQTGGRLCIIRPGVVFGPGEMGNVTRLVREMLKRQRAILLRPDQPKAGIYIEELIELLHWLRAREPSAGGTCVINGVSDEHLTFNAYARVLQELLRFQRAPLHVSAPLLRRAIALARPLSGLLPASFKLHPGRLEKLLRANDIRPTALVEMHYPFAWPLERALADWLERGL